MLVLFLFYRVGLAQGVVHMPMHLASRAIHVRARRARSYRLFSMDRCSAIILASQVAMRFTASV